jgi:chemotaxis protein CheX
MDSKILRPFINAAKAVIETSTSEKVLPGDPFTKQDNKSWGYITGVIGLSCEQCSGNMLISFGKESALKIVSKMIFEDMKEINKDVIDAIGEITNMVVGNAKREFSETGYIFNMALPIVFVGENVQINQINSGPTITIPFNSPLGEFAVEVNLKEEC